MKIDKFKDALKNTWLDIENAVLNKGKHVSDMVHKITQIDLTVPKMSTTHIGLLISLAVSCLNEDECYVNIGTWKGYSFFAGFLLNNNMTCIGNDNFALFNKEYSISSHEKDKAGRNFGDTKADFYKEFNRIKTNNTYFVEDDWKSFLSKFKTATDKKIGFYFYDGDHSFEAQYNALKIAIPLLSQQCAILVDDINLPAVMDANKRFLKEHNDFSIMLDLPTPCNRYPTWWNGIQIISRNR